MNPSDSMVRDGWILFATRCARMFAYGLLSVVLVLYLVELGLSGWQVGLLLSLAMFGDMLISLWLTTAADRWGRRRTLIVGAGLMLLAGAVFALADHFAILLVAATIGVISPSGNEIGPFLAVEQAALSNIVHDGRRTDIFAWYNLAGSFAVALGTLCGGILTSLGLNRGWTGADPYRPVLFAYAAVALVLVIGFLRLSPTVECPPQAAEWSLRKRTLGLHDSRGTVFHLSLLFALDAFGGGFVIQSIIAYWFHLRFNLGPTALGVIFMVANLLAGFSALAAGWLARRIGLVNTMVFTHLPSNLLLILIPFMPNVAWAVGVLLLRFGISQMDVPTRQAYTMAVVRPDERSAAAGITGVARSLGASVSPLFASIFVGSAGLASLPFILAGGLKIIYDLLLFRAFAHRDSAE